MMVEALRLVHVRTYLDEPQSGASNVVFKGRMILPERRRTCRPICCAMATYTTVHWGKLKQAI